MSLQILRAIAALSVVYVHNSVGGDFTLPQFGAFGVDVFFIISGFIMMFVMDKSTDRFLVKRLQRIIPMYYLATFIMIVTPIFFSSFINNTRNESFSFLRIVNSLLFFPDKTGTVLGQGWTLNYEMFFYIWLFLCILFLKNMTHIKEFSIISLFTFVIIVKGIKHFVTGNIYLSFYSSNLFFEFIAGMIIYYIIKISLIHKNSLSKLKFLFLAIWILSLAALIYINIKSGIGNGEGQTSKIDRTIAFGIPAFFLVLSTLLLEDYIPRNKFTAFLHEIGNASYVMYLFHYFILKFFTRLIFAKTVNNASVVVQIALSLLNLVIVTVISLCIYYFLDKPIQTFYKKVKGKKRLTTVKAE